MYVNVSLCVYTADILYDSRSDRTDHHITKSTSKITALRIASSGMTKRQTTTNYRKSPQTTTRIWDDGYSCAGKKQLFCLSYGSFKVAKPCWWSTMLLRIPIIPNPAYIYDVSVVVCGDFEADCLVGKPPQITTEMP